MKYVAILLHIYQPPTQIGWVIDQIAKECYLPLSTILNDPSISPKVTLNINFSLTEQLIKHGWKEILDNFNEAAGKGFIEFTSSGAYHPIFPLIPEEEIKRQLRLNEAGNMTYMPNFKPQGVFPPEMCYSTPLAMLLAKMGYKWVITDDLPFSYYHGFVPYNFIPKVGNIRVVLRSNLHSNDISFNSYKGNEFFYKLLSDMEKWFGEEEGYIVIAMDGETFGHHHKYYHEKFLRAFLCEAANSDKLQLVTISELVEKFEARDVFVPPSTWSATATDLANDDPYPLWQSKFNPIHAKQWELLFFALEAVKEAEDKLRQKQILKEEFEKLRLLMDKALYSCQFWWASAWNFDPSQIYRGAFLILDVLQVAAEVLGKSEYIYRGRELFLNIIMETEKRRFCG